MFHPLVFGVMVAAKLANGSRCPVCSQVKMFSPWVAWTCCQVAQCRDCAAVTRANKSCRCCGSKVG
jgi:hypothetical protein